jgi:UDP-galactopyranose mutase
MLGTDYREIASILTAAHTIYTGPIDAFFDFKHGRLPYRSLEFAHVHHPVPVFQSVGTVNHPNDYAYTRVTEFKHLTGQSHAGTSLVYEYPRDDGDPYYPIPTAQNAAIYERYDREARELSSVTFVGRLASYRYYNMDQVVGQALATFKRLRPAHSGSSEPVA